MPPEPPNPVATRIDACTGVVALLFIAVAFHLGAHAYLEGYYATHLPHYDSIGSYTWMFNIVGVYEREGWSAAFQLASHYDLSWLQGLFAAAFAPILEKTPASMQLYNTMCVFAAMAAIYAATLSLGLSPMRAVAAALLLFVPDVFYEFQGGLCDLQRDPSFVLLLAASLFCWIRFSAQPGILAGIALGLLMGMTTLSRANALPIQVIAFGPLVSWELWSRWRTRRLRMVWGGLAVSGVVYVLVAGAFVFLRFFAQLERYRNPYVAYAIGDSAWESLGLHWTKPLELVVGQIRGAVGNQGAGVQITTIGVVAATVILLSLVGAGLIRFEFRRACRLGGMRWLLACVAWVAACSFVTVILLAKPRVLSYAEAKHPFYPSLMWFWGAGILIIAAVQPGRHGAVARRSLSLALILACAAGLGLTAYHRLNAKRLPGDAREIATVAALTDRILSDRAEPPMVAFLWNEGLSLDAIKFYAAQKGRGAPFKLLYEFDERWHDFDVVAPPGVEGAAMLAAAEAAIRGKGDVVVANADPDAYRSSQSRNPVYSIGGDMVNRLLHETAFVCEESFTFRGATFVVLRRK